MLTADAPAGCCLSRRAGPALRSHTSGGAGSRRGARVRRRWGWWDRLGAAGGRRAGGGWVPASSCYPGLCGPPGLSVPPAPWAIATPWGPTKRWWFQVRGSEGGGSGTPSPEGVWGEQCAWEGEGGGGAWGENGEG